MEQDLFQWEEPEEKPTSMPAPAADDVDPVYRWNWWDPWPSGLTHRECLMRQISRDRRALVEDYVTPDDQTFYAERIASYTLALKEMGGDVSPQQASTATPGKE